jgi:hypothetical protein
MRPPKEIRRRKGLEHGSTMTREEHERLYALVQNPHSGSKMGAARDYGVELTLNRHSLTRTPAERGLDMESAVRFAEELQRTAARLEQ